METGVGSAFYAVEKNLIRTSLIMAGATEKSFAHLHEQAHAIAKEIVRQTGGKDILSTVLTSDEAAHIYRESYLYDRKEAFFAEVNRKEEPYFKKMLSRFFKYYLCDAIAKQSKQRSLSELIPMVCGELAEMPTAKEKTVAFLRNGQAMRAFECFAKSLGGVSAVYESNFPSACEAVYSNHATYAIIPIFSTMDGRLNSFYRQIEKYELSIVMTCDVDSDDGESSTTFALVYKDRLYAQAEGEPLYECKINLDDLNMLADLADAASYFGAELYSAETLPVAFSGRNNTIALIFGLKNANLGGFFTYLALEYPQTATVGIYTKLISGAKNDYFRN